MQPFEDLRRAVGESEGRLRAELPNGLIETRQYVDERLESRLAEHLAETRRHFDVGAESLYDLLQLIAEGLQAMVHRTELEQFRQEVRDDFGEVRARLARLERGRGRTR